MSFSEFMQNYGGPAACLLALVIVCIGALGGDDTDGDLPL